MLALFNPNIYNFTIYAILPTISGLLILICGFYFFIKNPRSLVNISYLVFAFFLALWLAGFGLMYAMTDYEVALFWLINFAYLGVTTIPANFYFFSSSFIGLTRQRIVLTTLAYALAAFFYAQTVSLNLISGLKEGFWGYFPVYNLDNVSLLVAFFVFFYFYMIAGFINCVLAYKRKVSSVDRRTAGLLIIGFVVAWSSSIDHATAFFDNIYPTGYISIFIFNIILAYTVARQRLMIATSTLTADNVISTIADSLIVTDVNLKIEFINQATIDLLGFTKKSLVGQPIEKICQLNNYLNQSVWNKLKQKGIIKNIEAKFKTSKKDLVIPVDISCSLIREKNGKTAGYVFITKDIRKMRKMVQELSDKTKSQEAIKIDLDNKIEQLEKFQKMAVGRELKMIELKSEIKKLQNKN